MLERVALTPDEMPLTITVPIDGVPLLRKVADDDLSALSNNSTEINLIEFEAA